MKTLQPSSFADAGSDQGGSVNWFSDRLLAPFNGAPPPAPAWFARALAQEPEPRFAVVDGLRLEYRVWGVDGDPGVLLLHGNLASARWWSWTAPWIARSCRVVAMSLAGMGLSDFRPDGDYSSERMLMDVMGVAEQSGLFNASAKPVFVGHSAGGAPVLWAAARAGDRLAGAVLVDSAIRPGFERVERRDDRPAPRYPDLATALGRFRFAPPQPCENLFLADFVARAALKQTETGEWAWGFDPRLWTQFHPSDAWPVLPQARCPLTFVIGEHSPLMGPEQMRLLYQHAPEGTRYLTIAEAHHHVMIDQPVALAAVIEACAQGWQVAAG